MNRLSVYNNDDNIKKIKIIICENSIIVIEKEMRNKTTSALLLHLQIFEKSFGKRR